MPAPTCTMTWCVSIGSYPTRIASFGWNCARKVNSADIPIYAGCLAFFYFGIFLLPTHNLYRHISATTEEQVTALLQRVKELTGMPDSAILLLLNLYFKFFNSYHYFLSSHSFNFKSLQMRKLHWRHATSTARPQWMWPSSWMTGMPPTKLRLSN
jgi:hypothetical protein